MEFWGFNYFHDLYAKVSKFLCLIKTFIFGTFSLAELVILEDSKYCFNLYINSSYQPWNTWILQILEENLSRCEVHIFLKKNDLSELVLLTQHKRHNILNVCVCVLSSSLYKYWIEMSSALYLDVHNYFGYQIFLLFVIFRNNKLQTLLQLTTGDRIHKKCR